ncbi:TonB-dependent receptor [Allosphingosinicella sp.]|uniref:TonB-dependent receptor n=1 Tax=Allosphingosinicella sp. TaxID=2823234 RepID=UPI00378317B0
MTNTPTRTSRAPLFLALGAVGFLSSPALAAPDEIEGATGTGTGATQTDVEQRGNDVVVNGARQQQRVESPKATSSLLDTPQTVSVISDQILRRQNLLTLRDALATIPGITFGAGEGGGGYGDAINLRGYSASNDITQDGVRDSAQYSRTDPFNLQQIEIYNGANSVFNGSGSVGGTINLASKVPQRDNLTILSIAGGTDNYLRGTVDTNWRISPAVAVRLNGMVHRNDVPGRDVENYRRWGIAPSITFGMEGPTSLTVAYVHQRDDNIPIYGVPYFLNQLNDGPLPGADDSAYYGYRNLDAQRTTVDRLTLTFRQEITDQVSLRSLGRWQKVDQYSQTSAPQGTFCLAATGLQPITANNNPNGNVGAACTVAVANVTQGNGPAIGTINVNVPAGSWQPNGPRGLVRDQSNELLYSQTDLRVESGAAGRMHNILVLGASFSWEDYSIETALLIRNAAGAPLLNPLMSIANPDSVYTGPINYTVTARSNGHSSNTAIYAFDTLEFGPHFELNAGMRYEWAKGTFQNVNLPSYPPGTAPLTALQLAPQVNDEHLFSYRVGAVYKPNRNTSIYVAYGNARTPTSATVRLGCGVVAAAGSADPCQAAPETARNYEVGVKADLFNRRLNLTAALFRNERSNFRVPSNDPTLPGLQVVDGRSRVDGLALGASGNITDRWAIFANYTYLDSEVLQSVSDFCLAHPSVACLNANPANFPTGSAAGSIVIPDPQRGDRLIQTPKHSGSLFTTWRITPALQIGYGFTYQGRFATHQRTLLQRTQYFSDDYITQRLFLSYAFSNGMTVQLNVQNLFNAHYYTNIRNNVGTALTGATANNGVITGGWATPGERRSAVLSLFYSF